MAGLGGREAFEKLFAAQSERLHRMAYCFLHDEASAEDAVQETFTQGLGALHRFRGQSRPEVWLYSIALNVCRGAYRRARTRESTEDPARIADRQEAGRGPLTSLLRRETAVRLAIALGHLTDLQREAFILHNVEELAYEDIAPMLGVSVVGARGLAHRAREKLRSKLPPGFELPGS